MQNCCHVHSIYIGSQSSRMSIIEETPPVEWLKTKRTLVDRHASNWKSKIGFVVPHFQSYTCLEAPEGVAARQPAGQSPFFKVIRVTNRSGVSLDKGRGIAMPKGPLGLHWKVWDWKLENRGRWSGTCYLCLGRKYSARRIDSSKLELKIEGKHSLTSSKEFKLQV